MHCNDARQLMLAILDEETVVRGEFDAHLSDCRQCRTDWRRLSAADSLLRSSRLAAPPDGLAERVADALAAEAHRAQPWRRHAMELAWVLTGVLVMASAFVTLLPTWRALLADPRVVSYGQVALRAGTTGIEAVADAGLLLWPVYGLVTVAMAVFWFGAIVVPLHTRRLVRSRA